MKQSTMGYVRIKGEDGDRQLAIFALKKGDWGNKKNNGSRNIEGKSINQMKAVAETSAVMVMDAKEFVVNLQEDVRNTLAECVSTKGADDTSIVRRDKLDAEVLEQLIALYWTIFL